MSLKEHFIWTPTLMAFTRVIKAHERRQATAYRWSPILVLWPYMGSNLIHSSYSFKTVSSSFIFLRFERRHLRDNVNVNDNNDDDDIKR